jgi:hypothetical protein
MSEESTSRWRDFRWWAEVFAAGNLGFLALDIYVAHSINHFENPAEWIPFVFSAVVPFLLLPGLVTADPRDGLARIAGYIVGAASILVGVGGMIFHLESSFFIEQTLHSLVYSAPFAAPLAYAGLGLLVILNRMETEEWARWVLFLAFGGFVGNFALSVLDHAQNGFFYWSEYVPVVTAAFGASFLGVSVTAPMSRPLRNSALAVMGLQVLVGLIGFGLHLNAGLTGVGETLWEKIVYGAPVFAPLLFPNMAILAVIGLLKMPVDAAETA